MTVFGFIVILISTGTAGGLTLPEKVFSEKIMNKHSNEKNYYVGFEKTVHSFHKLCNVYKIV